MWLLVCFLVWLPGWCYGFAGLDGVTVVSVRTGDTVDLGKFLSTDEKSMLILGTYAADFNAIEYAQRLRYYLPLLQARGVTRFGFLLNAKANAATLLAQQVGLDTERVELLVDPTGRAGRAFGVGRGWLPDNNDVNPFLKLFGMLWGLGAWATLPAVIGGYIGNPFVPQPWIQDALAVGQTMKRWPDNALVMEDETVLENKFDDLPWVGGWKRRPLELATLRLQSMLGISLAKWKELSPDQEALDQGVLTQLGACLVTQKDQILYEWRDPGICAVANFEDVLKKL